LPERAGKIVNRPRWNLKIYGQLLGETLRLFCNLVEGKDFVKLADTRNRQRLHTTLMTAATDC